MLGEWTLEQWAWLAGAIAVRLLWQGAAIGLFAAAMFALMRGQVPARRYALGCTALLAFALLIPLNLSLPPALPAPPTTSADLAVPFRFPTHLNEDDGPMPSLAPVAPAVQVLTAEAHSPAPSPQRRDARPRPVIAAWYEAALPWVGGFWGLGVMLFGLRDLLGLFAVARLRARGVTAPDELLALANRVRQRIGLRTAIPIRVVEGLSTAMVTGLFRVVILLPTAMVTGMPPEAVEAILAHEFAHLQRWDRWVNLLQCLLETLLFFHPALWWLSRRIRTERELCCDEMAIQICPDRALYVRALLNLAERANPQPAAALSSHGGDFSRRVRHILHMPDASRSRRREVSSAGVVLIAFITVVALAWSRASDASGAGPELRFSDLRAIGTVQARWEDDPRPQGDPWLTEYSAGWTVLDEAKGLVTAPRGAQVKLSIGKTDMSALKSLPPDAIYFLDARWRDLTDNDIAPIAHLTGLRALDLSENRLNFHGQGLSALAPLKSLEWLNLWFSPIDTLPDNAFRQFPHLRFLSGHFKHNSGAVMREMADLQELEFLSMRSGTGVTSEDLLYLSGKTSLRGLVLYNMELTDDVLSALQDLPNLRYLGLGRNALSDTTLRNIATMKELRYLDLHKTAISDAGVEILASLPHLETINLEYTNLTPAALEALADMPSLYDANLVGTQIPERRAANFIANIAYRGLERAPTQHSSNPDAPRIGLVISHFTCTGPDRNLEPGEHYNYGIQDSAPLASALNEANFDVYAVLEPGTEYLGELPGILRAQGLANKVIDVTDEESLLKLDAVITCSLYNAQPELLLALRNAVEAGLGLVTIGALGDNVPGASDPMVAALTGVDGSVYTDLGCQEGRITVLRSHTLLGNHMPGAVYPMLMLIGSASTSGVADGTVLIEGPREYGEGFPALYVRELGEGRIVRAQWHHPMQPGLPFPGYTFYIRALNWVAHEDVDVVW